MFSISNTEERTMIDNHGDDEEILADLEQCQAETDEANSAYLAARQDRDEQIRIAIAQGVTMYAIAKRTGLSEQAVAKIRDRARTIDA